jgi:hypothetical protein
MRRPPRSIHGASADPVDVSTATSRTQFTADYLRDVLSISEHKTQRLHQRPSLCRRGLTLGELVEAALQRELAARGKTEPRPAVPILAGRGGLRPGVDATSNRALLALVDEGAPIEKLR